MKTVLYDAKICKGINELKRFIEYINEQKHKIVSVTQRDVCYTIIYEYFGNE
jgi:hypothetical protein